ncbi:thioredoxin-like protein [Venturia nashicola]|uniref:Thioredoxin-like protein n=1 Tax=Venturia nashicola TaxID=86259 RepID=A0A4Z1NLD9_9PEZI|nr:thioredoxin-like protein [Venturia nashicola]
MTSEPPKITLYTNHGCPYAHRAHIALDLLKLPYDEVIIDLDKPREPWYLQLNPRGLVPALSYTNGPLQNEILTESSIVAQFLSDAHPSSLLPASNSSPTSALKRARIHFFIDTWNTKIGGFMFAIFRAKDDKEKEATSKEWVVAVQKDIEPLLNDASPFFGGSSELTLAEVNIAPFLLRIYALSSRRLLPTSVKTGLDTLPNFSKWVKATVAKETVTKIWNEDVVCERTASRIAKLKAQAANGHK